MPVENRNDRLLTMRRAALVGAAALSVAAGQAVLTLPRDAAAARSSALHVVVDLREPGVVIRACGSITIGGRPALVRYDIVAHVSLAAGSSATASPRSLLESSRRLPACSRGAQWQLRCRIALGSRELAFRTARRQDGLADSSAGTTSPGTVSCITSTR